MRASIALSGGGARGAAHVGVLNALLELGIEPVAFSGTSAGSIVGALYCHGYKIDEVSRLLTKSNFKNRFNFKNLKSGVFSLDPLREFLEEHIKTKRIEDLSIPLFICAANYNTGEATFFNKGNLIETIIASCSIPIVFPPVFIDNVPYVDGGLSCNLPVEPLLTIKEKIIGVHTNAYIDYSKDAGFIENIDRTFNVFLKANMISDIKKCAVFIEPKGMEKFQLFEYSKMMEMEKTGYEFVKANHSKESLQQKK